MSVEASAKVEGSTGSAPDAAAAEATEALEGVATYQCSVCRQRFTADGVYESEGLITCTGCWNRANTPASEADPEATEPAPVERSTPDAGSVEPAAAAPAQPTATALAPSVPVAAPSQPRLPPRPVLLPRAICPHCWSRFAPGDLLWVSRHAELVGDPIVGPDAALRFLPSRFNLEGAALDARGMACQSLACPVCHLIIPRPLIEAEPLLTSIVGVASSGKSYFMTAMTWELRRLLPKYFGVSFGDADASFNRILNHREETLFLAARPDQPVKLDKTDTVGSLMYDQIRRGQQVISLPRPFMFTMRPSSRHPHAERAASLARVVVMYDNAGEHFSPGEDTASSPVTQHLGASRALMFLFDPTQDARFRARCKGLSEDPQLDDPTPTRRQETVLLESAGRMRQLAGLPATHRVERPLLVVVPKADVWGRLINLDLSTEPLVAHAAGNGTLAAVDLDRVEGVSAMVREMLLDVAPEFVDAAEQFSANVVYIPSSALGASPRIVPGSPGLWIKPLEIRPRWVTVPFLYMFARWSHDVISGVRFEEK